MAQSRDTSIYSTDEIDVIGSRISLNSFESPTRVQILGSRDIESKNGETLSDALQTGTGVLIKSYGGNNSLSTISMNGLGAEHTLILLNGFKLNSSQNNLVDLSTVSKDNIEKIEIMSNGMSSIYGSEAVGGVINIITKNNSVDDFNVDLKLQAGSYEQKKIYLNTEGKLKNFKLDVSYLKESALNNFDYYFDNGIEKVIKQRANSDYDISNYAMALDYLAGNEFNLGIYSNYSDQNRNLPGIETGSAPSNSFQTDKLWNTIFTADKNLDKYSALKFQFNFQNNLSKYVNGSIEDSYYRNLYLANTAEYDYKTDNFEIAGGYDVSYSTMNSNETYSDIKRIQTGIFAVSKINFTDELIIYPSVRYDYISDIGKNVVSGTLGFNVKPFQTKNLYIKASAGNNYASPTFNELYWKGLGTENLRPENSVNIDGGVIYGFDFLTRNTIEISYNYIDAKDKIVWTPGAGGIWRPENIGRSVSNVFSADLGISKDFNELFSGELGMNYSYTSSLKKSMSYVNDPTYDKQIFYVPEHLFKFKTALTLNHTGVNLFYTYTGSRYIDVENRQSLPAFHFLEGNVWQKFFFYNLDLQLKLEVNNILNEDYQIVSGYPMPLRNFKLSLNLEY